MKKIILSVLAIVMLAVILSPCITIAVNDPGVGGDGGGSLNIKNPLGGTNDINSLLKNIVGFLIVLAIPISMILVVYSGFLYITSAGNEDKIKTAQKTLIWALVGFAVVLVARSVPVIIENILYGGEESGVSGEAGVGIGAEGEGEINLETEEP